MVVRGLFGRRSPMAILSLAIQPTSAITSMKRSGFPSHDPTRPNLLHHIRDMTGNIPGEGGLITFPESNSLVSIVLPHQPHFIGQPSEVTSSGGMDSSSIGSATS